MDNADGTSQEITQVDYDSDVDVFVKHIDLPPRYVIEREIDRGGMGVVLLVHHQMTQAKLAVKVMLPQISESPVYIKRFKHEAMAAGTLNNQHIVKIVDFGVTERTHSPFLVMDYVDGISIRQRIERDGTLSASEFYDICLQICDALTHAHHHKIIHRDLKPANMMITEVDGVPQVKLLDFGLAKSLSEDQSMTLTRTGEIIGSPLYMSPEQGLGHKTDHRSDIYSFGCIMYEMLTGHPPFRGANSVETIFKHVGEPVAPINRPEVPHSLELIIMRALQKEPDQRYQTVDELAADLRSAQDTKKVGWKSHYDPTARMKRNIAAAAVLLVLATASIWTLIPVDLREEWQGQSAMRSGDYRGAAPHFRAANQAAAMSNAPLDSRIAILHQLGHAYENCNDYDGAESAFVTLLDMVPANDPRRADFCDHLGDDYVFGHQLERGKEQYLSAIKLKEAHHVPYENTLAHTYMQLGSCCLKANRLKEAESALTHALADSLSGDAETHVVARTLMAKTLDAQGHHATAADMFNALLKELPSDSVRRAVIRADRDAALRKASKK